MASSLPAATFTDAKRNDVGYNPVPVPKDHALESLPRVSTARVPLLKTVPTEIHLNSYKSVAKSEENPRYITVKRFAHGKILDIGSEIHRLSRQTAEKEKEEAVEEAENRVWTHAEEIRIRAISELQQRLEHEHNELIKRLQKQHQQALKEEGLRVETAMRQLSLDQVKDEREDGEKRLKKAVADVEERCRRELETAVSLARQEEQSRALQQLEELDSSWQKKHLQKLSEMRDDKEKALKDLTETKDWEKQRAVIQTRQSERALAETEMDKLKREYESRIQVLNHKIVEKDKEIHRMEEKKIYSEYLSKEIGKELFLTRDTLNDYIHMVCQVVPGQADYQMPATRFKRELFE